MSKLAQTLIELDEEWATRLLARLEGLTDEEYLWEPVAGCLSIRKEGDDVWLAEWGQAEAGHAPLTTIAARMWHLGARPWHVPPPTTVEEAVHGFFVEKYAPDGHTDREACGSAAGAAASIEQRWKDRRPIFENVAEDQLLTPLGPAAHRYASACWFDLELHCLDERIHHAAEVALMRDLYRVRGALGKSS